MQSQLAAGFLLPDDNRMVAVGEFCAKQLSSMDCEMILLQIGLPFCYKIPLPYREFAEA